MELWTFLFVKSDERQMNCLLLMKSCGTLGVMFHLKEIIKKSKLFENFNDAYTYNIISKPMFATWK